VRFAAGPPNARARQAQLAVDGQGQLAVITIEVDLYNPNPLDLEVRRFDYHLAAGGAEAKGSVPAGGRLLPQRWSQIRLSVPLGDTPDLRAAIAAGQPYVLTGSLALAGGATGLAVGVSGEGIVALTNSEPRVAQAAARHGGAQ
jgi:hypothetical protein